VSYQTRLGWEQFLKGWIVTHWAKMQDHESAHRQLRYFGSTWAASLVLAIWDFSWSLWDHCNELLHKPEVQDQLLDMDAIDFEIIVEWHAGSEDLWPMDKMRSRGITLVGLLALPGH
jgi:hypothetical protein